MWAKLYYSINFLTDVTDSDVVEAQSIVQSRAFWLNLNRASDISQLQIITSKVIKYPIASSSNIIVFQVDHGRDFPALSVTFDISRKQFRVWIYHTTAPEPYLNCGW